MSRRSRSIRTASDDHDPPPRRVTGARVRGGLAYPPIVAFVKGAPDIILDHCSHIQRAGVPVALTEDRRREVLEQNRDMASNALRVLGVAYRPLAEVPESPRAEQVERDLIFVGLLGMIDPARPEVVEAVKVARGAGLKSIMVTGDYKDTAEAIAAEIGLRTEDGLVLTGAEIEKLTDQELAAKSGESSTCAAGSRPSTRPGSSMP